jgi:hypothetical protein
MVLGTPLTSEAVLLQTSPFWFSLLHSSMMSSLFF